MATDNDKLDETMEFEAYESAKNDSAKKKDAEKAEGAADRDELDETMEFEAYKSLKEQSKKEDGGQQPSA